jgi:hypothetical protein
MSINKITSKLENDTDKKQSRSYFVSRNWTVILILGVIGFYLVTEHHAHLLGVLPWLILLACPFLHFFMHRGHGSHNHSSRRNKEIDDAK